MNSFLSIPWNKKLYVIDNSENNNLEKVFKGYPEVQYYFVGKNLGFGKGHNYILDKIDKDSAFHLILNPDIYFEPNVTIGLMEYARHNLNVGIIAPLVFFPDGTLQHSFRRYPNPFDLIIRRIPFIKALFHNKYEKNQYFHKELNAPFAVDSVMGCFQLFRTNTFKLIKGFDERYFMYMEDIDICKKVTETGLDVVLHPGEKIVHHLEKGSAKSFKLFKIHLESAIKYFKKWGW
ncbi:glycosyltransferase [Muricauda sp. CAU 1633]|uniref:galactosyltransferase-related protein n=1 Tax=Allomuricauda sp. CAU 1633 TaxID=2816036 RepID=UPI001A8ED15F|nr:galactosyltransferase-related protein [Muricauda sp. CAU 1633]MBO0320973.1 glycosyltransferase [Muricauda sp. CAU 1633]